MTYHHSKHETCIVMDGTCMYNCPTFFLFWKCLDDMSYWTNLYRTVADNELHFFTISNLNYTVFVRLALLHKQFITNFLYRNGVRDVRIGAWISRSAKRRKSAVIHMPYGQLRRHCERWYIVSMSLPCFRACFSATMSKFLVALSVLALACVAFGGYYVPSK